MLDYISIAAHILGFIGMMFVVVAYHNVAMCKWSPHGKVFNGTNLIGAIMLLISLLVHFNLGSFIIEVFWIAISINALYQHHMLVNKAGLNEDDIESRARKYQGE